MRASWRGYGRVAALRGTTSWCGWIQRQEVEPQIRIVAKETFHAREEVLKMQSRPLEVGGFVCFVRHEEWRAVHGRSTWTIGQSDAKDAGALEHQCQMIN